MRSRLIIYAKRPLPGYAKTRLGRTIGMEASAGVYARLLYTCLLDALEHLESDIEIELSLASHDDLSFFQTAFPELLVRPQAGEDLGERMANSFAQAFAEGAGAVVLAGSDIPGLDAATVRAALSALHQADVVIGPAQDGGYYLIGLNCPCPQLFENIAWSTDQVLIQTQERLRDRHLSAHYLPIRRDADEQDDWETWASQLSRRT